MAQILNSGKAGNLRYSDADLTKFCPALDDITLLQNLQNAYEETQGYSLGNNKGNPDSIDTNLDDITEANVSDYNKNLAQLIQTYVANNSYLDVDPASTANNIILVPRKIADVIAPNAISYSKATSLPFAYRDNLRFVFRATLTNTGATQFSIKDNALAGLVGAKDITTETGANLIGGEIIAGKFYEIVLTGTGGVQKGVLIGPNQVPQATETVAGIAEIATQAEAAAALSDTTIITPLKQRIIQVVNFTTGAFATGSTVIPFDDTIPQITEGNEFMSLAFTPTSATNILKIDVVFNASPRTISNSTVALFKVGTSDAIGVSTLSLDNTITLITSCAFTVFISAGSTSLQTFKVRGGQASGAMDFNGVASRKFGGKMASSITITEIKS